MVGGSKGEEMGQRGWGISFADWECLAKKVLVD